jgi:CHAD domain-containing protein
MRVATRRLRAFLRTARTRLDRQWAQALRDELRWLGGVLGDVRDLDVLLEHLRADAESLEPRERRTFARVLGRLEDERGTRRAALLEALRSERYVQLLDRVEEATTAPKLAPDADERPLSDLPAAEFRRLRRAVKALPPDPTDEELHELRIHGKRARYAAELAERAVGKPATRFIAEAKRFQDVLGEHQDAVVAEERLRALVREGGGAATGLAVGRVVERQRERRRAARAALPAAWKRLERRGKATWQ